MKPGTDNTSNGVKGFTLIELMIALVILAIATTVIYEIYNQLHKTWLTEDLRASMQQSARVAMDNLVRETMMMGYGASEAENKITIAGNNTLEFKVYSNDDSKLHSIKYELSGANLIMHDATPNPVSGLFNTDATGAIVYSGSFDRTLSKNVKTLSFAYYDADNVNMDPSAGGTDTQDERNKIRRVTITLVVESETLPSGDKKEMTLTADLSPRNLWEGEVGHDLVKPAGIHAIDVKVRDAQKVNPHNSCGNGVLKVKWVASTEGDLAGYLVKWGTTSGNYVHYKDVPVTKNPDGSINNPTETEISDGIDFTPYYSAAGTLNKYYVIIQTYDGSHNYSVTNVATDEVAAEAPDPDETDFDTGSNDSSCDLPKPLPPSVVEVINSQTDATIPNKSVKLAWTKPADDNVIGYRIYRSYTTISTATAIDADGVVVKEIAKETANGGTLDYNSESFIDNDPTLLGCKTYYYAICSVTCDTSRILGNGTDTVYHDGGRYGATEYTLVSGSPFNSNPPDNPSITSQAGWKRVFLQVQWPTNVDYEYTKIYFKAGATDATDLPGTYDPATGIRTFVEPDELIPDHQTGYSRGKFKDFGTNAEHTIIFNSTSADLPDYGEPQLDNNTNYTFVAVAYNKCGMASSQAEFATTFAELCGDDPCGAPKWSGTNADGTSVGPPFMYVDETATQKDASLWVLNSATLEIEAPLGLKWTDVNKTDAATALDFYGYTVKKRVHGTSSWTTPVSTGEWNNYTVSTISEGETYDFCVQAADCAYHNITVGDTVCCPGNIDPDTGLCTSPEDYDWVVTQAHNITRDDKGPTQIPSIIDGAYEYISWISVSPGRIKLDSTPAVTEGEFHNTVKFYIRNTSRGTLTIRNMRATWGNSEAYLNNITIGGGDSSITEIITSAGLLASGTKAYPASFQNVQVTDVASAPGSPSVKIPVTIEFTNADGVADGTSDMSGQTITLEFRFRNDSMPNAGGSNGVGSADYLTDFTTGDIEGAGGATPISITVTRGPDFKFVVQNKPLNPTVAFDVISTTSIATMPSGYPEVGGLQNVVVTGSAGILNPLGNILDSVQVASNPARYENVTSVVAYYAKRVPEIDPVNPNPSDLAFTTVTTVKSGNTYSFTIPGDENIGAWYYFKAYSNLGNFCRQPDGFDDYYYYRQLGFDPCSVTPATPIGLGGTPTLMNWSSVTKYADITPLASADAITYDVYRREGLHTTDPINVLQYGISDTSFTDATYSSYSTIPLVYMVKARNTCPDPASNESEFSNKLVVCPTGGGGSVLDVYPTMVYLGQPINVSTAVCSAVGDAFSNGYGYVYVETYLSDGTPYGEFFRVYENGNTGISNTTTVITMRDLINNYYDNLIGCLGPDDMYGTLYFSIYDGAFYGYIPVGSAAGNEAVEVKVAVNPCDNVPNAPTGLTGNRTGTNITLTWNRVTTNTDGTDAVYPPDGSVENVSYEVYEETSTGVFSYVKTVPFNAASTTYSANFKSQGNTARRFFVRAKDKCASNNAEEETYSTSVYITL